VSSYDLADAGPVSVLIDPDGHTVLTSVPPLILVSLSFLRLMDPNGVKIHEPDLIDLYGQATYRVIDWCESALVCRLEADNRAGSQGAPVELRAVKPR